MLYRCANVTGMLQVLNRCVPRCPTGTQPVLYRCATLSYRYTAGVVQVCHPVLQVHYRCTGVPPCSTGTLQVLYRCAPRCPTGTLQVLYKLKTGKLFDKNKCRNPEPDDDPFAVQHMYMCAESRLLAVAGITHVILFRFCKQEKSADCQVGPR